MGIRIVRAGRYDSDEVEWAEPFQSDSFYLHHFEDDRAAMQVLETEIHAGLKATALGEKITVTRVLSDPRLTLMTPYLSATPRERAGCVRCLR